MQIFLAVMLKKFEVVTVGRTSGGNGPFLERKLRHRDAGSPVSDLLRMDRDLGFHARLPGIVFGESAHRSPQVWGLEEHLVHPDASATPPHTHTHTDALPQEPCLYPSLIQ